MSPRQVPCEKIKYVSTVAGTCRVVWQDWNRTTYQYVLRYEYSRFTGQLSALFACWQVPFVTMSGDVGFDESGTFLLGKENGEENTEKQKWILPFPGVIPSKTSLTFGASVTQGRLEVPFIAILQSGERQWKEEGTLTSTNCFSLRVDCFGVKVDSNSYNSL